MSRRHRCLSRANGSAALGALLNDVEQHSWRLGRRTPLGGGVDPGWCLDVRGTAYHPELPTRGFDCSVVAPAEQNSVISMSWAAVLGGVDVVDLTPRRGDPASGDGTPTVARHDGLALGRSEAALRRTDAVDAAA